MGRAGTWGFGTVWKALDKARKEYVAIKVMHSHLAGDAVKLDRFFRGARVMQSLTHRGIVRVLEPRGEDEGYYYFVMELMGGGSFSEAVSRSRITEGEALAMLLDVGDDLAEAHARGCVHRDVKPRNILLTVEHQPKLSDFDLVGVADTTGGTSSGALGTYAYAAPECLRHPQNATPAADVFSLAMTAVFALSSEEPDYWNLGGRIERLPCGPSMKAVLRKATTRDPRDRYEDARALVGALREALASDGASLWEASEGVAEYPRAQPSSHEAVGIHSSQGATEPTNETSGVGTPPPSPAPEPTVPDRSVLVLEPAQAGGEPETLKSIPTGAQNAQSDEQLPRPMRPAEASGTAPKADSRRLVFEASSRKDPARVSVTTPPVERGARSSPGAKPRGHPLRGLGRVLPWALLGIVAALSVPLLRSTGRPETKPAASTVSVSGTASTARDGDGDGDGDAKVAAASICQHKADTSRETGRNGEAITLGTIVADVQDRRAIAAMVEDFEAQQGVQVIHHWYDHEQFKRELLSYLRECPDDVIAWLAGERVSRSAFNDHVQRIPGEIWDPLEAQMPEPIILALERFGERYYTVPFKTYPWAFYYRRSLWRERGYEIPNTWAELLALVHQMRSDGLDRPIAFANAEGWPAMGTFDILDMRINGYGFHSDLMRGIKRWNDPQVRQVFEHWRELLPYYTEGWELLKYKEGTGILKERKAGMYFVGGFVVSEVDRELRDDLGVFAFPEINPAWKKDSIDAPIDGFILSWQAKGTGAHHLIRYLGNAEAFDTYNLHNPGFIGIHRDVDTTVYERLPVQRDTALLLAATTYFARFMDRETQPLFAKEVIVPALRQFLQNPTGIASLLEKIEERKKRYPSF